MQMRRLGRSSQMLTRLIIALLLLALPVSARQPKPAPKQPVAATPAQAMAPQRTVEQDLQLRQWIADIMETADKSTARADAADKHADAAEQEAKASRDQTAIAIVKQQEVESRLTEIQRQFDSLQAQVTKLEDQHKKDVAQLKRFGKLVGIIAAIAATFAALYVFEMTKTGGAIALMFTITNPIHYGLPLLVWGIVFAAVEVYLRYVF